MDKTRSRGLGPSIVKHLLKAQNGWMGVESALGSGTVVKLFLPMAVTV